MKEFIGILAVVLTFLGYIPYYRDLFKGKTQPHFYTWFLLTLLTVLIVALQLKGGAGPGVYITITAGFLAAGVTYFGYKQGLKNITKVDTATFILGLVAVFLYAIIRQDTASIIIAVIADTLAFAPTVRKTWNKPYTETLSLYVTNAFRFGLVVLAIENYNLLSTLWPVVWAIFNGGLAILIIYRRKKIRFSGENSRSNSLPHTHLE